MDSWNICDPKDPNQVHKQDGEEKIRTKMHYLLKETRSLYSMPA